MAVSLDKGRSKTAANLYLSSDSETKPNMDGNKCRGYLWD